MLQGKGQRTRLEGEQWILGSLKCSFKKFGLYSVELWKGCQQRVCLHTYLVCVDHVSHHKH